MLRKLAAIFLILSISCLIKAEILSFEKYQVEFNKKYFSVKEYQKRKLIYEQNLKNIQEHNQKFENGEVLYTKGVNQFTDLAHEEFVAQLTGLPEKSENQYKSSWTKEERQALKEKYADYKFKENFNYVDQGVVTSVKNQGHCGSCAAFAVTASIESCFALKGNYVDDLSEQFLVDCGYGYEWDGYSADGCDGAWPQAYFAYLYQQTGGKIQKEKSYPYTAEDGQCSFEDNGYFTHGLISDQIDLWGSNEDELKSLLVEYGPVVTTIDASHLSSYESGIFHNSHCCDAITDGNSCTRKTNHAVLVVGYGNQNGHDYWLVKNSWGKHFGMDGYFKMKYGTGHCGFGWEMNNIGLC